jgi:DNA-binding response OmpR family regulator
MRRPTRVLVVEDDASLRRLYRTALLAAGYDVTSVEDGLDALRQIELEVPGGVVLDLELPRLSGRDVRRELAARQETAGVPVVVVTGGETRDLEGDGVACILHKPIHPEVLVCAIENCLRGGSRL